VTQEDAVVRLATAVRQARRYRDIDFGLVRRIAAEELPKSRTEADALKRVKRRLHQAVGAYRSGTRRRDDPLAGVRAAWAGDLQATELKAACRALLAMHASTRERLPDITDLYPRIWEVAGGRPGTLLDLGCGLGPIALPWMQLPGTAQYGAVDVDTGQLATVDAFLDMVGQPHTTRAIDLAIDTPATTADLALLLKLVPILDRREPAAAERLLRDLDVLHAAVSFPGASLGGRGKGMDRSYRLRMERLLDALGSRVRDAREASVASELVFVLELQPLELQPTGG
jgi:16S rRNA (guanine(1405)-N(7))-methyltransferase